MPRLTGKSPTASSSSRAGENGANGDNNNKKNSAQSLSVLTAPSPPLGALHPSPTSPPHPYHDGMQLGGSNNKNKNDDGDDDVDEDDLPPPPPPPPPVPKPTSFNGGGGGGGGGTSSSSDTSPVASEQQRVQQQEQQDSYRITSTDSKMSDTSIGGQSAAGLESVLEYSTEDDTSDDGAYWRINDSPPPSLLGSNSNTFNSNDGTKVSNQINNSSGGRRQSRSQHHNHHNRGMSSGGSSFRELKRMGSRRIVQFQSMSNNSDLSSHDSSSNTGSSVYDHVVPVDVASSPSTQVNKTDRGRSSSPNDRNIDSNNNSTGGKTGPRKIKTFMAKMAYAFRSPSGIYDVKDIPKLDSDITTSPRSSNDVSRRQYRGQSQQQGRPSASSSSSSSASKAQVKLHFDSSQHHQQQQLQHDQSNVVQNEHYEGNRMTPLYDATSSSSSSSTTHISPHPGMIFSGSTVSTKNALDGTSAFSEPIQLKTPSSATPSPSINAPASTSVGGHFRKDSSGTTEYPYSMLHLMRDPIHIHNDNSTATNSDGQNDNRNGSKFKSTLAQLQPSSPLLPRSVRRGRGQGQGASASSMNHNSRRNGGRQKNHNNNNLEKDMNGGYGTLIEPTVETQYHPLKHGGSSRADTKMRNQQRAQFSPSSVGGTSTDHYDDNNNNDDDDEPSMNEMDPLMMYGTSAAVSTRPNEFVFKSRTMAAKVAAYFLLDYESSRPPTLSSDFASITPRQLALYRFHFSWMWRWFVNIAIVVVFLSHTQNRLRTAIMHTCVIIVFAVELRITEMMYGTDARQDRRHGDRRLVRPMVAFLFFLGLESWMWYLFSDTLDANKASPPLFSSMFKPLVFFYVSSKARDSLEALARISKIVSRVLIIEFFLILTFAAVGCRMFGNRHDSFHNLSTSWLSLFELSTTVVNPSLWMPMYEENPTQAIYFVIFIITCIIYFHSLVLSVVFQTYIMAMGEIHERSVSDREDAARLAFLALIKDPQADYVSTSSVKKCLQVVRPHYKALKLKALVDIVDPANQHIIDYPSFRTRIRQALNASIRTARTATSFAMAVELIAVIVAVSNFMYVIMVTSAWDAAWFENIQVVLGSVITILGLLELLIRFNPLRFQHFTPITRLNVFFDGVALVAAVLSFGGIVQYAAGFETDDDADFLLMGRAMDMVRVMRFFPIFRDVVRRSSDVLPAMAGPLVLLLSVIHEFVFVGMIIWSGAIDVETLMENETITPLYCLNNFNSYTEGLVTVFNLLIVNDWHAIAEVYLYAEWNSRPLIVYSFFISAICISVFIMLNVITAFFVESFVTKRNDLNTNSGGEMGDDKQMVNHREFQIRTGENTNVKRVSKVSSRGSSEIFLDEEEDLPFGSSSKEMDQSDATSTGSGEVFAFDIYEREGYDHIMATVAGLSDEEQEAFARSVCNYLEIFESLASGREKVGYMVCCQQSTQRFGNRRFQNNAAGYLTDDMLHQIVSEMHSEMLVLTIRKNTFEDRCLVRTFPRTVTNSQSNEGTRDNASPESGQVLEITATLLRYQPAATLFVSRIRPASTPS